MADNEEVEESTARGNGWEVVSLTESTYAASPGPQGVELNNDARSIPMESKRRLLMHCSCLVTLFFHPVSMRICLWRLTAAKFIMNMWTRMQ
ncbi:hypothetical protein GBA52_022806 [Prunus armeniaca]|nr:hypothetical protein GBA52_022806 [Prunus armeniaca]